MTTRDVVLIGTFALAAGGAALARQSPAAVGQISGHVTDEGTGQPVTDAVVTLSGTGPMRRAMTDASGAFEFTQIAPGFYGVLASKPGYATSGAGQHSATGLPQPLSVVATEPRANVVVPMWRLGTIAGVVSDATSEPLPGIEVHGYRRALVAGTWQWTDNATTSTDDRGRYRLTGLPPGDYLVAARPTQDPETPLLVALLSTNVTSAADVMAGVASNAHETPEVDARVPAAPVTFAPAVTSLAKASVVAVGPAAAVTNINVRATFARGRRVAGQLAGVTGALPGAIVHLVTTSAQAADPEIEVASAACDEDGRFAFANVAPGSYALSLMWMAPAPPAPSAPPQASAAPLAGRAAGAGPGVPPPAPPLPVDPVRWAHMPISVSTTDVVSVQLPVRKGFTMSGRAVFGDAVPPPPDISSTVLRLDPAVPAPGSGPAPPPTRLRLDSQGRVTSMGVPTGRYFLRINTLPRGWTLVSAMTGGHDALDEPIDIHASIDDLTLALENRPLGSITGTVSRPTTLPTTVIVFAADAAKRLDSANNARRMRATRPLAEGQFTIGGLAPGAYLVVALDGDAPAGWQDPARLAQWASTATHVDVALGETAHIALQVDK
jgi:protocatechuate 3,4-dioxygenase beta subunit